MSVEAGGHAYTPAQARALMRWVSGVLGVMRAGRDALTDAEAREALSEAAPTNGGGAPGRTVGEGFVALRDGARALAARGIVLRDLDRGLVDFPSEREGRPVFLCWEEASEPDIAHWHELDAGHAGRRPLDEP